MVKVSAHPMISVSSVSCSALFEGKQAEQHRIRAVLIGDATYPFTLQIKFGFVCHNHSMKEPNKRQGKAKKKTRLHSPARLLLDLPFPLRFRLSSEMFPVSDGGEADFPASEECLVNECME
jgi:hypothetical protein